VEIKTKTEFFKLWQAGLLGNRLRIWDEPEQVPGGVPIVGLRQIGVAGGGKFAAGPLDEMRAEAAAWRAAGRRYMVCEAAPDDRATIQGEVQREVGGLRGFLAWPVKDGKRMRDSMRDDAVDVTGLRVKLLLDHYMDPSSRADLDALLEHYPDSVVEFTCYSCLVGFIPGRNTIFWEVRNY
jgi:hypothetical protein